MIKVRNNTGDEDIELVTVDTANNAFEAATALYHSVKAASRIHGGTVRRLFVDNEGREGVCWEGGPTQWAAAYVVSEGAEGKTFSTFCNAGGCTVLFFNLN